jgi:hypothetical protein
VDEVPRQRRRALLVVPAVRINVVVRCGKEYPVAFQRGAAALVLSPRELYSSHGSLLRWFFEKSGMKDGERYSGHCGPVPRPLPLRSLLVDAEGELDADDDRWGEAETSTTSGHPDGEFDTYV